MKKFFRRLAVTAAAFASLGSAHAGVINFDTGINSTFAGFYPLMSHNDAIITGGFDVFTLSTKAGAAAGDLVGSLVNGSDLANSCSGFGLICPNNNSTNFLAALNDGLLDFSRDDGDKFRFLSFDAAFIGTDSDPIASVPMILQAEGYIGSTLAVTQQFNLPGTTGGALKFNTFTLNAAFQNTTLTEFAFRGFYCAVGTTTCVRTLDKAQFAVDNISFAPEPGSTALVGMALIALTVSRRRAA